MNQENDDGPDTLALARSLIGFGINMLVTDMAKSVAFLDDVFGLACEYQDEDFAIIKHDGVILMMHSDASYAENTLLSLTGDGAVRGAGLEIRLYGIDPDTAFQKAKAKGHYILAEPENKAHHMREAYIVGPDGYVWVPSIVLDAI